MRTEIAYTIETRSQYSLFLARTQDFDLSLQCSLRHWTLIFFFFFTLDAIHKKQCYLTCLSKNDFYSFVLSDQFLIKFYFPTMIGSRL